MKIWPVLISTVLALGQGVAAKDELANEGAVTEEAPVEKFPGEKLYLEKKKLDQGLANDISKKVDEETEKEKNAGIPDSDNPESGADTKQKTEKELEEEADKSPEEKLIDKHFDAVEKELNEHDR